MSVVATAAAAFAGAAALAGAAFAVQLSLSKPPSATRLGTTIETNVRLLRVVWSAGELNGRRISAMCRTTGNQRYSLIALGPGRRGLASWRRSRMFDRGAHRFGPLLYEVLLAGCSAQVQRFLAREIRVAYQSGRPLRIAPARFKGRRALRIRILRPPRLVYLFVDPKRLAPIGLMLRTPTVFGWSILDARQPLFLRGHRRYLH
jgi:hypothetical protein